MTELETILTRARERKFLGPLPLAAHLANGNGFVDVIRRCGYVEPRIVDLGSGGGVPALVIATMMPSAELVLVERGARRAEFLEGAITELGLGSRVQVVIDEAENAARRADLAGTASVVTARSFAPPAVTAECACRFLAPRGRLIVSEPPDEPERWSSSGLAALGLVVGDCIADERGTFQIVERTDDALDARYPRRAGTTRKRPLW